MVFKKLMNGCILVAIVSVGLHACKTTGRTASLKSYQRPEQNEFRVNWLTNRSPDYGNQLPDTAYSANVTQVLPNKGVLRFQRPQPYEYGQLVTKVQDLPVDDNGFNEELAMGAQDPQYAGHATIFVHGYNETFENALDRSTQIYTALESAPQNQKSFRSKTFTFAWPSVGKAVDDINIYEWFRTGQPFFARNYIHDEQTADASVGHLEEFVHRICRPEAGYKDVNVIAHSLGARLTVESLAALSRTYQASLPHIQDPVSMARAMPCRIKNLVIASGDMSLFRFRNMLPDLLQIAEKVTLYVNATVLEQILVGVVTADIPLALSKLKHFFSTFELGPRVGQQSLFLQLLDERVEIVVMKYLDDAQIKGGHNHIFSSPTVLQDMTYVLTGESNLLRTEYDGPNRKTYFLRKE